MKVVVGSPSSPPSPSLPPSSSPLSTPPANFRSPITNREGVSTKVGIFSEVDVDNVEKPRLHGLCNLDEKVSERVLYDILIQAGHVVDLYIPRDKETQRIKGFAFAEYESEEIAEYVVKLFSGLVTLHNKLLKFSISGQDKIPQNSGTKMTSNSDSSFRQSQRPHPTSVSYSGGTSSPFSRLSSNGHRPDIRTSSFDYSGSIPGSNIDSARHETYLSRPAYDSRYSIPYPPYY